MPSIIPSLTSPVVAPSTTTNASRKVQWGGAPSLNFDTGEFDITQTGQLIMLNDAGALIQWIRKALITARYRFKIYYFRSNSGFGNELVPMLGKPYHDSIKENLAVKYTREAIEFDSRINTIKSITAVLQADVMMINVIIITTSGMELQFSQLWTVK